MKFTIPNIISLLRVILSPIFFVLLVQQTNDSIVTAFIIYHIAAITDFFDGYLARKLKSVSEWGNFFDPLADKVLTTFAFIGFVVIGIANIWLVLIIILRDVFTTWLRVIADKMNEPIVTSRSAKWKTFLQMIYISGILLLMLLHFNGSSNLYIVLMENQVYQWGILLLAAMTIYTAVEYIKDNRKIFALMLLNKKNRIS